MDRAHFDALARSLAGGTSRRAMLGTALGAAILGLGLREANAADNHKRRQRRRRKNKNKNATTQCYGTKTCDFSNKGGQYLNDCNFAGSTALEGGNCGGCNLRDADLNNASLVETNLGGATLRNANLRGANLAGANLRGSSLRGACLTDVDLTDVQVSGSSLRGSYQCRTTLPDGTISNANCLDAGNCCLTCVGANGVCSADPAEVCCDGLTCCNGVCVNLQSDVANCGSCEFACLEPATCSNATCEGDEGD